MRVSLLTLVAMASVASVACSGDPAPTGCEATNSCTNPCNTHSDCEPAQECAAGQCEAVENPDCTSTTACTGASVCELPATAMCLAGRCTYDPKPSGAACDDDDPCTEGDLCDGRGACATVPSVCNNPPPSECIASDTLFRTYSTAGTCDSSNGDCAYAPTDTACTDCTISCLNCANDADCGAGQFCAVDSTCTPLLADGGQCAGLGGGACLSDYCDGALCCTAGSCCNNTNDCPAAGAATCLDPGPTTPCQGNRSVAQCSANVCGVATVEDDTACGAGNVHECADGVAPIACTAAVEQDPPVCPTGCTLDADCATGFRCDGGSCVLLAGTGDPCVDSCGAGLRCENGVCCGDPGPPCCDDDSVCGGLTCDLTVASCFDTCTDGDESRCATPGEICLNNACGAFGVLGGACIADAQCASGECSDSVCCDTPCNSQCRACSFSETGVANGTCTAVLPGLTDPESPNACDDLGNGCAGSSCVCDGATECVNDVGNPCTAGAQCLGGACQCSVANCSARVCAEAICGVCEYSPTGLTVDCVPGLGTPTGVTQPSLCSGAQQCFLGGCLLVNGESCIANDDCGSDVCCGTCSSQPCVNWWDNAWPFRRELTVANPGGLPLVNVPVLVKLVNGVNFDDTLTQITDIRFVADDQATLLDHEIEQFNVGATSYLWVEVPMLPAAGATIWLYHGNFAVPMSNENPAGVWNLAYSAVYHMGESSPLIADSTGNARHATADTIDNTPGVIGDEHQFFGSEHVLVPASVLGTSDFTISVWGTFGAGALQFSPLVSCGDALSSSNGNAIIVGSGNDGDDANFLLAEGGWTAADILSSPPGVLGAAPAWFTAVRGPGSATSLYVNGQRLDLGMSTFGPATMTIFECLIGASHADVDPQHQGRIDEVRFSSTFRSQEWITVQYNSMIDNLITYGAQEAQ